MVKAATICERAAELVKGDRADQHGDMVKTHENIAALWSAYLGTDVTAHDVACLMALLKLARTKAGTFNADDYVDLAGYAGVAAQIAGEGT